MEAAERGGLLFCSISSDYLLRDLVMMSLASSMKA